MNTPQTEAQMIATLTNSLALCAPRHTPPPLTVAEQRDCLRHALIVIAASAHTGPEVTLAINNLVRAVTQ